MKHFSILTITFLFCMTIIPAKAQITVTSADFPIIGSMVVNAVDTITPVSPGDAGTNQVWDFSNLVASRYDTTYFITPTGTPNYQNYPASNIVIEAKNYPCEGCTPVYSDIFAINNEQGMWMEGLEMQMNFPGGFIMNIHGSWPSGYRMVPLPLNYGDHLVQDVHNETYTAIWYSGMMVDSGKSINDHNITMDVDASGTLITPYNTFQVLRVKEVSVGQNYIYTWTTNGWELTSQDTDPPHVEYTWYTNDYFSVCACDGESKGNGFTFFRSETYVGQDDPVKQVLLEINPNPATNMINLKTTSTIEKVEIINLSGAIVQTENNSSTIEISKLQPGIYMLKVKTVKGVETGRFIKQ